MLGCVFITQFFIPEEWQRLLQLRTQVRIGSIAYSSIMLTVFRQRVLAIYLMILGHNRAAEALADPLTRCAILLIGYTLPSPAPQNPP